MRPLTICYCLCTLSRSLSSFWYLPTILLWPTSLRAASHCRHRLPAALPKLLQTLPSSCTLSTFVFWCLLNCFSEERPLLNRSWRSLNLWESGQERGPAMPGIPKGTELEFSYDGLYIWKPGKSCLAGFKDIWLTVTQSSMKGIPDLSIQCPLGVRFFCSASPVSRTSLPKPCK